MHRTSFKGNSYLIIILLTTLLFILFIFYVLNNINHNKELINKLENTLFFSKEVLNNQQQYALSLSILLSEDQEVIQSFLTQNVTQSFAIINRKIKRLKQLQNIDFEVQIHNKDLTTYLRSWDISKRNIALDSFRQGVVKVHQEQMPYSSIEVGKRLNIKAISPIVHNNNFIGSLEVIIGFENLTQEFKQKGYELFVLMHKDFLNIATQLANHHTVGDFVLVNQNEHFKLEGILLHELEDYGYISNDEYAFSYFSYYDLHGKKIGYFISGFKNEYKLHLQNSFQYNNATSILKKQEQ